MKSTSRHALVLTVGSAATAVFAMLYTVLVARRLGPAAHADFAAALALLSVLLETAKPVNHTVTRFASLHSAAEDLPKVRAVASAVLHHLQRLFAPLLIVSLLLSWPLSILFGFETWYLAPLVIATAGGHVLLHVARGLLRGLHHFGSLASNLVAEAALRLLIGVLILRTMGEAAPALSAYLLSVLAALSLATAQLRPLARVESGASVDEGAVRTFARAMFVVAFLHGIGSGGDMLLVHRLLPEGEAGIYGAAISLARGMYVIAVPSAMLLLPLLSARHAKGHSLTRTFLQVTGFYLTLAGIPLALLAWKSEEIVLFLFGQDYASAAGLLFPLAAGFVFAQLSVLTGEAFAAQGEFGFAKLLGLGVLVQLVGVAMWHESPEQAAHVVMATKGFTALLLLSCLAMRLRRASRNAVS